MATKTTPEEIDDSKLNDDEVDEEEFDDTPRREVHTIEPAKSIRSSCQGCRGLIAKGALRLREVFGSQYSRDPVSRYYHLGCGVAHVPHVFRQALADCPHELPDRAALEEQLAEVLTIVDAAQSTDETSVQYHTFIAQMCANPDDEATQLVFADWLQEVNDPRGELIAIQAQKQDSPNDASVLERERELLRIHGTCLLPRPLPGRVAWRRGFIERFQLTDGSNLVRSQLQTLFAHPSMALLRELSVEIEAAEVLVSANLPALPRSLAVLELDVGVLGDWTSYGSALGDVSALVDTTESLRRLRLVGHANIEVMAHGKLVALELRTRDARERGVHAPGALSLSVAARITKLSPQRLPALRHLRVEANAGLEEVCHAVVSSRLLAQLSRLVLRGQVSNRAARTLAAGLRNGPRQLTVDLGDSRVENEVRQLLEPVCDVMVQQRQQRNTAPPPMPSGDWLV
ncbi:MAG: TIGR02996 domain-containing protein [Deltaproteobacteria bacterium]|nr:TIGR02996 domain-containing protein [Deltaproteobacteria bacterium]